MSMSGRCRRRGRQHLAGEALGGRAVGDGQAGDVLPGGQVGLGERDGAVPGRVGGLRGSGHSGCRPDPESGDGDEARPGRVPGVVR